MLAGNLALLGKSWNSSLGATKISSGCISTGRISYLIPSWPGFESSHFLSSTNPSEKDHLWRKAAPYLKELENVEALFDAEFDEAF